MAEQAKKVLLDSMVSTKSGSEDSPIKLKKQTEKQMTSLENSQKFSSQRNMLKTQKKKSSEPLQSNKKNHLVIKVNPQPKKTPALEKKRESKTQWDEDVLKTVAARKLQMMTQSGMDINSTSPLQMHLIRSESLRIAQDKIIDLEEELHELRQKNESLASASEVLKEKNELLKSKLEDLKHSFKDEKNTFKSQKEILLSTLEEAKIQMNSLKNKKQELEKRLSKGLHGIRARESSLESRIEILKMENSVLQKEKDKKIIELQKQTQKIKTNMDGIYKKYQELQNSNNNLQESVRRTVASLRVTIYNLEGVKPKHEDTFITKDTEED